MSTNTNSQDSGTTFINFKFDELEFLLLPFNFRKKKKEALKAAIEEYTNKRVAEARAELEAKTDTLYSELENYTPPSTFSSSEANFNDGFYKGELKAMELVCVRLFNKDGDQLRRN